MNNKVSTATVFQRFSQYLNEQFDVSGGEMCLKYKHTKSVCEIATTIAHKASFSEEDEFIAGIIAILHDCARFPQILKYGTSDDTKEYNHSIEGGKLLKNGLLKKMLPETREYDKIIVTAVTYHGLLGLPTDLDERTRMHCELIRDADRTDLFNLMVNDFELLFGFDLGDTHITPKVKKMFESKQPMLIFEMKSQLDYLALRFGFLCQYKFKPALDFIKQRNYVNQIADLFLERRPYYNREDVEWVRQTALSFLD